MTVSLMVFPQRQDRLDGLPSPISTTIVPRACLSGHGAVNAEKGREAKHLSSSASTHTARRSSRRFCSAGMLTTAQRAPLHDRCGSASLVHHTCHRSMRTCSATKGSLCQTALPTSMCALAPMLGWSSCRAIFPASYAAGMTSRCTLPDVRRPSIWISFGAGALCALPCGSAKT